VVVAGLVRATAAMTLGPADQAHAVHDERTTTTITSAPDGSASVAVATLAPPPAPPQAHGADRGPMLPLVLALGTTAVIGFFAMPVGDVLARAAAVLGLS